MGSILEAPRLDFVASKAEFQRDFRICLECLFQVSPPRIPPAIYNAKNAKNAKKAKKANHLQGANAKSATTKVCFITMAWAKKGGRRWSPPGGYNPPPTESVQGELNHRPNRFQIHPDPSQMANLKGQALYARHGSYTPLFFSSQENWDDRHPATKFVPSASSCLLN